MGDMADWINDDSAGDNWCENDPDEADYLQWAEAVEDEGRGLTSWEEGFVSSILEQLRAGRKLSERQAEILERIYAEKTP